MRQALVAIGCILDEIMTKCPNVDSTWVAHESNLYFCAGSLLGHAASLITAVSDHVGVPISIQGLGCTHAFVCTHEPSD